MVLISVLVVRAGELERCSDIKREKEEKRRTVSAFAPHSGHAGGVSLPNAC